MLDCNPPFGVPKPTGKFLIETMVERGNTRQSIERGSHFDHFLLVRGK